MKHYNDQELDTKIHAFLSKKMQKYPELAESRQTVSAPSFPAKLRQALTTLKPLTTQ